MSTSIQVHDPQPPDVGMTVNSDDGTFTAFTLDGVKFYVHDPQWFQQVALWASREAVKLHEAQTAVEVCVRCDGDERLCAACATVQVRA